MPRATRIIPRPPAISKYFSASMFVLLVFPCANSTLLGRFHHRSFTRQPGRCEKIPEHLSEDDLLRQQRDREGEDQSPYHCHERDCHLHDALLKIACRERHHGKSKAESSGKGAENKGLLTA